MDKYNTYMYMQLIIFVATIYQEYFFLHFFLSVSLSLFLCFLICLFVCFFLSYCTNCARMVGESETTCIWGQLRAHMKNLFSILERSRVYINRVNLAIVRMQRQHVTEQPNMPETETLLSCRRPHRLNCCNRCSGVLCCQILLQAIGGMRWCCWGCGSC